jgi:hypothetical protein
MKMNRHQFEILTRAVTRLLEDETVLEHLAQHAENYIEDQGLDEAENLHLSDVNVDEILQDASVKTAITGLVSTALAQLLYVD